MTHRPIFSIITPSYNRIHMITDAVESVLHQSGCEVEHIIVDGGSTDGTLDELTKYPHLRVISEPDRGMYDAINKGIRMAQGEIIGLLNSDDVYEPGAFQEAARIFQQNPELEAVCGGSIVFTGPLEKPQILHEDRWIEAKNWWPRLAYGSLNTNAWFFRRALFDRVGLFQDHYRSAGDREFLLRMAVQGIRYAPLPHFIYRYRQHTGSLTMSDQSIREPRWAGVHIRSLLEDVDILEGFLRSPQAPAEARRWLRRAHTLRTQRLVETALYQRMIGFALRYGLRGWKYNLVWPFTFTWREILRAKRALQIRMKTKN